MARTDFTVSEIPEWGDGLADAGFEAADQTNGNAYTPGTEMSLVLVSNASGGALTVTLNLPASRFTANDAQTKTLSVATGDIALFAIPTSLYKQSDGKVWLDWSTDTSVTVAVCDIKKTPGL